MEGRFVQLLLARKALMKVIAGDNIELAKVAQTILDDPRLLIKYAAKRKETILAREKERIVA